MNLPGRHRVFLQIALFRPGGRPYSREVIVMSIDGDANRHHVEGNRYDRHDLVDGSSAYLNNKRLKKNYQVYHNRLSIVRAKETD
jgi:hypothetical protein